MTSARTQGRPKGALPPGGRRREATLRGDSVARTQGRPKGALPPGGRRREATLRGDT